MTTEDVTGIIESIKISHDLWLKTENQTAETITRYQKEKWDTKEESNASQDDINGHNTYSILNQDFKIE